MANLLLKLLPLFFMATFAASALLQVNIDCGASSPHTDQNGIKWVTDTSYITNGESYTIKDDNTTNEETMKTLRAFTSRKKNCYAVDLGKGGKQIQVRVSFNYGNYDGLSSPPKFDLMLDANGWASVETSMDGEIYYEGVYVAADDMITVCVGQSSPGMYPFVSAIQVWELDTDMYSGYDRSSSMLTLVKREAYGVSSFVRYPDDAYDRYWSAAALSDMVNVLKSNATTVAVELSDKPPIKVLENAVTPSDPTSYLVIGTDISTGPVQAFVNLYFVEPTQLSSSDKRSVAVFVDGNQVADPQSLKYATASEFNLFNMTASGTTELTVRASSDSTLPPIINALEVFTVSDGLSNGTDSADANGLAALMSKYPVLSDWSGDPCLPVSYNWDWVACSSDDTPRITALYLSGYGLSGDLPDFSSLEALEYINMQNNSITGGIPSFLGTMPNLKELNLADNSLSGPIPSSLANNKNITLKTSGNSKLCAAGGSCQTFSTPSPSGPSGPSPPGTTRRTFPSSAMKTKSIELMLGLAITLSFFAIVF